MKASFGSTTRITPYEILLRFTKGGLVHRQHSLREPWSDSKKFEFLDSLVNGWPLGEILFSNGKKNTGKQVILDGHERLSTVIEALTSNIHYDGFKFSRVKNPYNFPMNTIANDELFDKQYPQQQRTKGESSLYFEYNIARNTRTKFLDRTFIVNEVFADVEEEKEIYRRLNS